MCKTLGSSSNVAHKHQKTKKKHEEPRFPVFKIPLTWKKYKVELKEKVG